MLFWSALLIYFLDTGHSKNEKLKIVWKAVLDTIVTTLQLYLGVVSSTRGLSLVL